MIDLNINHIKKVFGAETIFEDITFDVKSSERIGLIGPNGCGKTTLLKIIYGLEHVQEGNVSFRKGLKIGYLDQIPNYGEGVKVDDILNMAFEEVFKVKKNLDEVSKQLGEVEGVALENALKEFARLSELYERLDGYNTETNISKVTTGLLITDQLRNAQFSQLSGGEKTRVTLAKILLEKPDLLMLDEPTNHLDLESIEWLESYLSGYDGSVLIVSHDRYFLDNVCNMLIELSLTKAHIYHGNYSYYVIEKERRFLLELKVYLAQQRQIKRMEEQIKRYRIWGEMRDSDKMYRRAKELEKRLSKIERLDKPKYSNDKMKLKNTKTSRSGKRVLKASNIHKAFDDLVLLEGAEVEIIFQDRLAILGNNGTGKTTLIKLLLEDSQLEEPNFDWGSRLNIGYLAQEVNFPDDSLSVLEYFMVEHTVNQAAARKELAKALFIRDDVFKKINMLSGGEKSKLKLCSLTYNQTNLLVLDEPTNHLDIDSREILEEMLLEFKGTILFISHDRYFIKKIATRIGEIEKKIIHYYDGDYDYFRFMKSKLKEDKMIKKKPLQENKVKKKDESKLIYKQIDEIEKKLEQVDTLMIEFGYDFERLHALQLEKESLEEMYELLFNEIDE